MSFKFSDSHISEFYSFGYTVFRSILPFPLVRDLRAVSDKARAIARVKGGPQTQRLQPVEKFDLDLKPFRDFAELPDLKDAVARVLTPHHKVGQVHILGILLEPAEMPYCTNWHRDWDNRYFDDYHQVNYFNQTNCALYDDSCTWVVPGSHCRRNTPGEIEYSKQNPGPELEGKPYEERERLCLDYSRNMPGAICLHLNAGDFALYRNCMWHLGNYVPYTKRATLHDLVDTSEWVAWRDRIYKEREEKKKKTGD